jgi:hypothetical protein
MPKPSLVPNKSQQSAGCRDVFAGFPARHRHEKVPAHDLGSCFCGYTIRKIGPTYDDGGTVGTLSRPRGWPHSEKREVLSCRSSDHDPVITILLVLLFGLWVSVAAAVRMGLVMLILLILVAHRQPRPWLDDA